MNLRQMVQTAAEMRRNHSFMLDISDKTAYEAAFITTLVKNDEMYLFFAEVHDIPFDQIYAACKLFEAQDALRKVTESKEPEIQEMVFRPLPR